MLVLNRRKGERILIGDDIVITVSGCRGSQVRIGIDAPQEVSILREEVFERLQRQHNPDYAFNRHHDYDCG